MTATTTRIKLGRWAKWSAILAVPIGLFGLLQGCNPQRVQVETVPVRVEVTYPPAPEPQAAPAPEPVAPVETVAETPIQVSDPKPASSGGQAVPYHAAAEPPPRPVQQTVRTTTRPAEPAPTFPNRPVEAPAAPATKRPDVDALDFSNRPTG